MTTPAQLAAMRANLTAARHRARRARYFGDRAGHLIAEGDARRLARAIIAAIAANVDERSAAR